jgi:hypothetical protein
MYSSASVVWIVCIVDALAYIDDALKSVDDENIESMCIVHTHEHVDDVLECIVHKSRDIAHTLRCNLDAPRLGAHALRRGGEGDRRCLDAA